MPNVTKDHVRRTIENAIEMLQAVKAAVEAGYTPTDIPDASGGKTLTAAGLAVTGGRQGCDCAK